MKKIYLAGLLALAVLAAPSAVHAEDIDWTFGKRLDTAEKKIKVLEDKVAALEGTKVQSTKPANPPVFPLTNSTSTTTTTTGVVGAATSVTYSESSVATTTVSSGRVLGNGFLRGLFSRIRGKIRGGGCCSSANQSVSPQYEQPQGPDEAPIYYNQRPVTYAPAATYSGVPAGWTCTPAGCFKMK